MKWNIWFYNYGEVSYTDMSPVNPVYGPALPADKDDARLISSDNWGLITVKVGEVREVNLPDGISPWLYCYNCYYLKFNRLWNSHDDAFSFPAKWQYDLAIIIDDTDKMRECVKLLTSNLRSAFRKSLKAQLIKWLETPIEDRQYASPFSHKQWASILKYTRRSYSRY